MLTRHDYLRAAIVVLAAVSTMWATTWLAETLELPEPLAWALGALGGFTAAILVERRT